MIKIPPIAKIYEAYSCIADNRIKLEEKSAIVTSSDYKKNYTVKWHENNYSSNDNASYWQGYPGYPIIAVLMLQNKLKYNKEISDLFKNINWHELNEKYKRDYDKAIEEVLNTLNQDKNKIKNETNLVFENLKNIDINVKKKI